MNNVFLKKFLFVNPAWCTVVFVSVFPKRWWLSERCIPDSPLLGSCLFCCTVLADDPVNVKRNSPFCNCYYYYCCNYLYIIITRTGLCSMLPKIGLLPYLKFSILLYSSWRWPYKCELHFASYPFYNCHYY